MTCQWRRLMGDVVFPAGALAIVTGLLGVLVTTITYLFKGWMADKRTQLEESRQNAAAERIFIEAYWRERLSEEQKRSAEFWALFMESVRTTKRATETTATAVVVARESVNRDSAQE